MKLTEKAWFRLIAVLIAAFAFGMSFVVGVWIGFALFSIPWVLFGLFISSLKRNDDIWDFYSTINRNGVFFFYAALTAILCGPLVEELFLEEERDMVDLTNIFR